MFADALVAQPFDVFLNTASLGEMRNQEIRHWMRFVQERLDVRYWYSLNRYLNVITPGLHDWRLDENSAHFCSMPAGRFDHGKSSQRTHAVPTWTLSVHVTLR